MVLQPETFRGKGDHSPTFPNANLVPLLLPFFDQLTPYTDEYRERRDFCCCLTKATIYQGVVFPPPRKKLINFL